jgi:peptidoglycan-N-acetylglucosamine deacetylase
VKRAAVVGAGVAAAHAFPAITTWPALRRRVAPGLSGIGAADHVALTFDDGPHRMSTPRFLEMLATLGVRATFFMLGSQVERAPGLAREVAAAGHEIGLHGYDHRCLLARTPAATFADLRRGHDILADTLGEAPRWWRPPYGVLTTAALAASRRLDMKPVLWTAWGRDWRAAATADSVLADVCRSLTGGGTVLLHDSDITAAPGCWRSTLGAVPRLIERCHERGWASGPLSEHRLRGIDGVQHGLGNRRPAGDNDLHRRGDVATP